MTQTTPEARTLEEKLDLLARIVRNQQNILEVQAVRIKALEERTQQ